MFKADRGRAFFSRLFPDRLGAYLALIFSLLILGHGSTIAAFAQTTISGTVYAPNGADPLPNVLVYVTTGAVAPFVSGAQCPGVQCQTAFNAIPANATVAGYTTAAGTFTLTGVPESTTYTLVIQAGKWRRQFSQVVGTTPIAGLNLDFPSTHAQGDIPLMAVATGSADALECALRDVGVADSEFTDDNGTSGGRIHLYLGTESAGAQINGSTPTEATLMSTPATLNNYDLVLFPCQGTPGTQSAAEIDSLLTYTSAGGRVFATHYSKGWIDTSEALGSGPNAGATFSGAANWSAQSNPSNGVATINTGFSNGARLAQWMQDTGESYLGTLGQVSISTLRWDTSGINAPTQSWLTLNSDSAIMQFSFNTPFGAAAANQYGRVFFNEYHVENTSTPANTVFPAECGSAPHNPLPPASMSAEEKMLEYTLFDLTNFVTPIVAPTVAIAITTDPASAIFNEGDTTDTITVDVTNTSSTNPLDTSTMLNVTLPAGLTATAMTDQAGAWLCTVATLSCTRAVPLAPNASDAVLLTVSVAGNATGSNASTSVSVAAAVTNPTFSSNINAPLSITLRRHAAVTWATPTAVADGTPLSSTQLDAVGNTTGTYVYSPAMGTVLPAGTHTLSVTFTPADQSAYPGTATASVTLLVNSAVAATVTAPATTGFGPIPVATASALRSVTFSIADPGTLGPVLVSTAGATGSDFTDAGTGTCSTNGATYVYSANATCTVDVIFTPTYPGQREGAVLLKDGSGNLLATAYLNGTGTGPQINFLPAPELLRVNVGAGMVLPVSLALDGNGRLYTADSTNHAIFQTTPGGVTTRVLDLSGTGAAPTSIAVDGAGTLYVVDHANDQILEAAQSGGALVLNPVPIATSLNSPTGLAVAANGNLYVAEASDVLLETRQPNGTYLQMTIIPASSLVLGSALNAVSSIVVDGAGNFFIADSGNGRVIEEAPGAEGYTPSLVANGFSAPGQLALDANGNVYVADYGNGSLSGGRIYKETPSGSSFVQSVVSTSLGSAHTLAVAVDASDNVYLSDVTNGRVLEENFAASPSLTFASTRVGTVSSDSPQSVTVENVGNAALVFTSSGLGAPIDFSQTAGTGSLADCADSASVAAGAACNISIRFAPTVSGNPLGEVFVLADNALNGTPATQNIAVSGPATAAALTLAPASASLAPGVVGSSYPAIQFVAGGGVGPYTYSAAGSLPPGLGMSAAGVLSGTPTAAGGPYSFAVTATDQTASTVTRTYTVVVNAAPAAQLSLGSVATSLVSGGNLGKVTATVEDANGLAVTSSSAVVTLSISGPGGYLQTVTVTAVNGVAVFDLTSFVLTAPGTYTVSVATPGLPASAATVIVSQAFTLAFTSGTGMTPTQSVSPGSAAVFPFTLAPSNTSFNGPITLSASGLPPGATYSFSPPVVTPGAGPIGSTLTVQTASSSAALGQALSSNLGGTIVALLLLPLGASRRLRKAAKRMPLSVLALALLFLGALGGLTGCGAGGLFGKAPQTYLITVTGTSGSLSRSTTVTLILQ